MCLVSTATQSGSLGFQVRKEDVCGLHWKGTDHSHSPPCRSCLGKWSKKTHHTLSATRRGSSQRCQSGTRQVPRRGKPCSVTRAAWSAVPAGAASSPATEGLDAPARASPLLNPRPHCPQHKGGNRKRLSQEISQHSLRVVLHRPIDHDLGVSHPRNKVSPLLLVLSLLIIPKQLAGIAEHQQLHTATPASTSTSSGGPRHRSPAWQQH